MKKEEFEKLVEEGIALIPERFLKMLENVEIVLEDEPGKEQISKLKMRKGDFLFGLYEGIPKTKRWGYGGALPDKITIFKNPIEKYAKTREEAREIVRKTVWHEIAHHFGIGENEVRALEKKKFRG